MKGGIWIMSLAMSYLLNVVKNLQENGQVLLVFQNNSTKTMKALNFSDFESILQSQTNNSLTITGIHVHQAKLNRLTNGLFTPVAGTILSIDLANNMINDIQTNSFQHLMQLRALNLSQNFLEQLESSIFVPLKCLIVLDLSYNNIKILPTDMLMPLVMLKNFNLTHNFVRNVSLILPSDALTQLNVTGNLIATLDIRHMPQTGRTNILQVIGSFGEYYTKDTRLKLVNTTTATIQQVAQKQSSTSAVSCNFNRIIGRVDRNMTEMIKYTKDLQVKINKIILDLAWLRVANICSALIVASCIAPVLVVLWRTKPQAS